MGSIWGFSTAELGLSRYLSPWNCTETVLTWTCLSGEQPELLFVQLLWDQFVAAGGSFPLATVSEEPSPRWAGGTQL